MTISCDYGNRLCKNNQKSGSGHIFLKTESDSLLMEQKLIIALTWKTQASISTDLTSGGGLVLAREWT